MFVKTKDFEESMNELQQMFKFLASPKNLLQVLGLMLFSIYMMFAIIILLG